MKSKDQKLLVINGEIQKVKGKKVKLSDGNIKPNELIKKKRKELGYEE